MASALVPKLQKTKAAVEQLLFEVAALEVGVVGDDVYHADHQWLLHAHEAAGVAGASRVSL